LYTITVNTCRGYLRKRKRRFNLRDLLGRRFEPEERTPCPETVTLRNEGNLQLWNAVNSLGEKHRLPIILRYVEELSTGEIAQVLDISEGTVRSRLHYGCRKLQGRLIFDGSRVEERER
jgi:RNA polymerase sigma-70 factor (ECF subfamily)